MNDRYLYRAKRKDNGEWVEGNIILSKDADEEYKAIIIPSVNSNMFTQESCNEDIGFENWYKIYPSTICQCTGLKDKNGKLIWENDIVEAWSQGRCAIGKIKHRIDGTWIMYSAWQNGEMWYLLPNYDGTTTVEVIGNIFDNKELLESEDKDENNY